MRRRDARPVRQPARGAALPFVLGALTVGLLAAASAASVVRAGGRAARGWAAGAQAGAAADGGLATVVAEWPGRWGVELAPGAGVWEDVRSAAGAARVRVVRLDRWRFALEAEARSAGVASGDEGPAVRRRALLVRIDDLTLPVAAAVTAGGPVEVAAGATVDGGDHTPAGGCAGVTGAVPLAAVAAPAVSPDAGASVFGALRTDSASWSPALSPKLGERTFAEVAATAAVRATPAGALAPMPRAAAGPLGIGGEGCALDVGSWGEPWRGAGAVAECAGAWPVVHLAGPVVRLQGPARFQGTLLVDGNLETDGLIEGAGVVVVRGAVRAAGAFVLDGALVAGGGVRLGVGSRVRASLCARSRAAAYGARASPLARRSWAEVQR